MAYWISLGIGYAAKDFVAYLGCFAAELFNFIVKNAKN
jgi:hypothetical protein